MPASGGGGGGGGGRGGGDGGHGLALVTHLGRVTTLLNPSFDHERVSFRDETSTRVPDTVYVLEAPLAK
jgi:hypothetical protein